MNNFNKSILATVSLISLLAVAPAVATPVTAGAVTGVGGSAIDTGAGDWIDFYIPLSGAPQTFDGTLTSDTCNANGAGVGDCHDGTLNMFLHFDLDWNGPTTLSFDFRDLDVVGFGDNDYFFEVLGLTVHDSNGVALTLTDAEVQGLLTGNSDTQHLALNLDTVGDVYVHMVFGTGFADYVNGTWRNTLESLRATAVSVPEPGTLALLGAGLLMLAFSRRRKPVTTQLRRN